MLNEYFQLNDLNSFGHPHTLNCANGTVVKVVATAMGALTGDLGATALQFHGKTLEIDSDGRSGYWCFFTLGMIRGGCAEIFRVGEEEFLKSEKDFQEKHNLGLSLCKPVAPQYEKTLQERYDEWVLENISVYELFCKFTLQAIASGKKKISHWLIVNRIRWEVEIETKSTSEYDEGFKISNDYIALLARDFKKDYPEHSDVFKLKQMKRA